MSDVIVKIGQVVCQVVKDGEMFIGTIIVTDNPLRRVDSNANKSQFRAALLRRVVSFERNCSLLINWNDVAEGA